MDYHLFTGCAHSTNDQWLVFMYEDGACTQVWRYHPDFGFIVQENKVNIPIEKRIYILSTTQHGYVTKQWEHKHITEREALELFYDSTFLRDEDDENSS
jgi:hypothetical protein